MAGKANKTKVTEVTVEAFLAGVESEVRRKDALVLCEMMERLSGEPPRMWGPSIVGFGVRQYRYESGREGETLKVGFSPRKPATVLYSLGAVENAALVASLGKITTGKGCVYVKSLADVDLGVLEALIVKALAKSA